MMSDEHSKFLKIMSARAKSIQQMLDFWMKGNIKMLIQTLKRYNKYHLALKYMLFQMF
jgi:hypothetical protein